MVPVLGTENVPIFGTFFFREYGFRNAPESLREHPTRSFLTKT